MTGTPRQNPDYLTVWDHPARVFPSEYGVVTYQSWCEREQVRLKQAGQDTEIKREGNLIALVKCEQVAIGV